MSSTGNIWNRVKAVAGLLIIFLLVLATNLMDKHHFEVVKRSLTTVYEDRLVVKDYLYKISGLLQHKHRQLMEGEDARKAISQDATDSIYSIFSQYVNTQMTQEEQLLVVDLRAQLEQFSRLEDALAAGQTAFGQGEVEKLSDLNWEMRSTIDHLFDIQMKEGKRQIEHSNRAIERSNLMAKLEIGALILIGLVIQVIVFYKPS